MRSGENRWTVQFKGGELPDLGFDAKGKSLINAGYTINLELWAEGTYGVEKAKPATVSVKVNIK